jgi:hypothetical protein
MPFINTLNVCFCLWAWVGGAVAAKLLIYRSPRIVTPKDGAKVGLFSGLIAGAIVLLITTPLMLWQMDRSLQNIPAIFSTPEAQELLERIRDNFTLKILFSFVSSFINSVFILGFTVLGGLLGVALFEKRKNQPPPPYPPQYPSQYPPQYPPQYSQPQPPPADYPPQNPPESAPPQSAPPQSSPPQSAPPQSAPPQSAPPLSGGSSGDQGDQGGQGGQGSWTKE